MLRLQNKYRNVLKKQPERIEKIAKELGMEETYAPKTAKALPDKDFLKRRLENEINALYDRLAKALKEENERLKAENRRLKEENERLLS